jgi:hypothetical protein
MNNKRKMKKKKLLHSGQGKLFLGETLTASGNELDLILGDVYGNIPILDFLLFPSCKLNFICSDFNHWL